jgi:hypothetical protein
MINALPSSNKCVVNNIGCCLLFLIMMIHIVFNLEMWIDLPCLEQLPKEIPISSIHGNWVWNLIDLTFKSNFTFQSNQIVVWLMDMDGMWGANDKIGNSNFIHPWKLGMQFEVNPKCLKTISTINKTKLFCGQWLWECEGCKLWQNDHMYFYVCIIAHK